MLLSAILNSGRDAYIDCMDVISESHFNDFTNKLIYTVYDKLYTDNTPYNITNVIIGCNALCGADQNRDSAIKEILSEKPEQTNVPELARQLRNAKIIKDSQILHKDCLTKLGNLTGGEPTSKIFSISESALFDLIKTTDGDSTTRPQQLNVYVDNMLKYWSENPSVNVGIPTPWPQVNRSIGGGIRPGVHLFGGRSGSGKSTVGLITSLFTCENNIPTLFIDTEMEVADTLPRLLASLSEVPITQIETGAYAQNSLKNNSVNAAAEKIKNMPFYYKSVPGAEFEEIMSMIRRWIYSEVKIRPDGKANPCLIVYDYFKLMNTGDMADMAEFQALGFQINKLTDFVKKYGIPCLSFVQLNRDGIDKESTAVISQSDRLLWACNSFSIFKDKTAEEMEQDGWDNGNKKIITLKSRFGGEHMFGQYISMNMKKDTCGLIEMAAKSQKDLKL